MYLKLVYTFIILLSLNYIVWANSFNQPVSEEIRGLKIPISPNAYDIQETLNKPPGTKSIFYKVKTPYPAEEILNYYDKIYQLMGMALFAEDNYGDRKWHNFIDATKPGNPAIEQLIATWVDKERKIRIVLALRYVSSRGKLQKEVVEVICQVQPFFLLPPK